MHAPAVWLRARRCVVGCPLGHSLYARVSCARAQASSGPYKAARDAYVAATATYTKSLYE